MTPTQIEIEIGRGKHGANVLWKPEHHDALMELLKQFSYRESADKLNAQFGTSYTRSAISGRMMRQGKGRPAVVRNPLDVADRKRIRAERYNERRKVERQQVERVVRPPREQVVLSCTEIEPLHVSLLDLETKHCRWPYGEGPYTFCGHPQFGSSSYCGAHFFLSIGAGTGSERAAHRVAKNKLQGAWG